MHAQAALPPTSISKIQLLTVGAKIYREQQNKDLKKETKEGKNQLITLRIGGGASPATFSGVVRDDFLDGLTSRRAVAAWRGTA
jgi:hypothetical protein